MSGDWRMLLLGVQPVQAKSYGVTCIPNVVGYCIQLMSRVIVVLFLTLQAKRTCLSFSVWV